MKNSTSKASKTSKTFPPEAVSAMKPVTYTCKTCGEQSSDYEEMFNCETSHVELTPEDKLKYEELKEAVKLAFAGRTCNTDDKFRAEQNRALKELVDFEEAQGILPF